MKFFNNLSRQIEEFKPIKEGEVTIYSCGPTVYDVSHLGHARSSLVWDILYRYLKYKGYKVKWARNITNVDDKIINRAKELGINADELSRIYTYEFWDDMTKLNVSWPSYEPRATDYICEMIEYIEKLIANGAAYESNGDVYFNVNSYEKYGQLKGQSPEDLRKGCARVEANENKKDKLDFALWKSFPDEKDATHIYDSPWGKGRPGWHLECSTMINSLLGDTIDIHSGGDDLIFPHHENECAQAEMCTHSPLANFWMHNGMIMIEGKKMSKSDNNYLTIKDLLRDYNANAIRYFILTTHYKKQLNYTAEAMKAAEVGFEKLYKSLSESLGENICSSKIDKSKLDKDLISKFEDAMDNDLNTSQALALIFENKDKAETVKYLLSSLGFDLANHKDCALDKAKNQCLGNLMELIIDIRAKVREAKDFETSDLIRDRLSASNIQLKDHKDGPATWSIVD